MDVSSVSRASFGIPLFLDANVWFPERTRSYSTLEGAAEDFPTTSAAYIAIQQAFKPDIQPEVVKVGRRDVDDITFTPDAVTATGQTYTLEVKGTDGVTITAQFTTSTGSETAADITSDLTTDLAGIVGVTVVDGTGTITLSKSGTDPFSVTDVDRMTWTTTVTETAAEAMSNITAYDDEFYFVASSDHTDAFVQALATDIESRTKVYFVAVQEAANLGAYSVIATDTLSKLKIGSYFRTAGWFHDTADTTFPEMEYIAIAAPAEAGKKIWANNKISSSAAKDPSTGLYLSVTQKTNLNDKNANYTEVVGGVGITRRGTVAASATYTIDLIRNRDFLEARISEAYQNLLINKPIIPYTRSGIAVVNNTLESVLSRYVSTEAQPNILQEQNPFYTIFPDRNDVTFADLAEGVIVGSFVAYLAGSIREQITVTGSLTYQAES